MEPTEKHSFHLPFFCIFSFIYDVIDYREAAKYFSF